MSALSHARTRARARTHTHTHTPQFDELVADTDRTDVMARERFDEYLDALYKREFATNYAEHWGVIKQQCELIPSEKCILHTPYAADCSQFPPAVGSLYLSADHLVVRTYTRARAHTHTHTHTRD